MAVKPGLVLLGFGLLFMTGCAGYQHISQTQVKYEPVGASAGVASDERIISLIAPYKAQLDEKMSKVVGEVDIEMTKDKPECTLGNWICDAMMAGVRRHGYEADLAISNYGGIRVPYLTPGPLTIGELYELSPFDNLLVIVDMPGNKLDTLFQHIAETEGWPVSAGVRMVIRNKTLARASINGKSLDPGTIYRVAMPDYVANGGDGNDIMIDLGRTQTGILVRDLLIEHAEQTTAEGKKINAVIDGRTVIEH